MDPWEWEDTWDQGDLWEDLWEDLWGLGVQWAQMDPWVWVPMGLWGDIWVPMDPWEDQWGQMGLWEDLWGQMGPTMDQMDLTMDQTGQCQWDQWEDQWVDQ